LPADTASMSGMIRPGRTAPKLSVLRVEQKKSVLSWNVLNVRARLINQAKDEWFKYR
jgi:hypothetical protein